jgi:hypothetical protein
MLSTNLDETESVSAIMDSMSSLTMERRNIRCLSIDETDANIGNIWLMRLPSDIAFCIHRFVGDIDMIGIVTQLCKYSAKPDLKKIPASSTSTSKSSTDVSVRPPLGIGVGLFRIGEIVFKHYCNTIYPIQFNHNIRKIVNETKFNSWKEMAIYRPRLRTNGFYSIKTIYSKPPNNDMFWEEKKLKSVEVKFYRHMRFYDNGNVLYSLSITGKYSTVHYSPVQYSTVTLVIVALFPCMHVHNYHLVVMCSFLLCYVMSCHRNH